MPEGKDITYRLGLHTSHHVRVLVLLALNISISNSIPQYATMACPQKVKLTLPEAEEAWRTSAVVTGLRAARAMVGEAIGRAG